jgi:hypothetical protein
VRRQKSNKYISSQQVDHLKSKSAVGERDVGTKHKAPNLESTEPLQVSPNQRDNDILQTWNAETILNHKRKATAVNDDPSLYEHSKVKKSETRTAQEGELKHKTLQMKSISRELIPRNNIFTNNASENTGRGVVTGKINVEESDTKKANEQNTLKDDEINASGRMSEPRSLKIYKSSERTTESKIKSGVLDKTKEKLHSSNENTDSEEKFYAHERMKNRLNNSFNKMIGTENKDAIKFTNTEDMYVEGDDLDKSEVRDYSNTHLSHRSNLDDTMHIHHDQQGQDTFSSKERSQAFADEESNDNISTDGDSDEEDYDDTTDIHHDQQRQNSLASEERSEVSADESNDNISTDGDSDEDYDDTMHIHHDQQEQDSFGSEERSQVSADEESDDNVSTDGDSDEEDYGDTTDIHHDQQQQNSFTSEERSQVSADEGSNDNISTDGDSNEDYDDTMHIHHDQQGQDSFGSEERSQVSAEEESNDNVSTDGDSDKDYDDTTDIHRDQRRQNSLASEERSQVSADEGSNDNISTDGDSNDYDDTMHIRHDKGQDTFSSEQKSQVSADEESNDNISTDDDSDEDYDNLEILTNDDSNDDGEPAIYQHRNDKVQTTLRRISSPAYINSDARIYNNGSSYISENEDGTENNKKIENQIHSRIDAIKREITKEEITRTNENRRFNREVEELAQYANTLAGKDDSNDGGEPEIYQKKDDEAQRILRQVSSAQINGDARIYKHGSSYRSENEDGTEDKKRIENQIHSHIDALKDAIKREVAKEEITRTNENRKVNSKVEGSAQNTKTLEEQEVDNSNILDPSINIDELLLPHSTVREKREV